VEAEVGSKGCAWAQRSTNPQRPLGDFVFLCHAPDMTLSEVQLAGACSGESPGSPRASVAWVLIFLRLGLGLH
jgi:hypothetical protein